MLVVAPERGYTLNTSISSGDPSLAMVGYFVIYDHTQRRRGWGRHIYTAWENQLQVDITKVYLRAKTPAAEEFWSKMGFTRLYKEPELNNFDDGGVPMIKHLRR